MKARLTLILNNSRSTLIFGEHHRPTDRATDSPDYRSNYLARHDRATPSSGDGIAVPTVLRVTRPPSTTEVIVTSLLPFSTVFEPISTRDDSYDFRHPRHGSPEQTLSLFLFFDRSRNEREQIGAKTRFFSPFFNSFGIFARFLRARRIGK